MIKSHTRSKTCNSLIKLKYCIIQLADILGCTLAFQSIMICSFLSWISLYILYGNDVFGCQDLKGLPHVYAKSMLDALTSKGIYEKKKCLLFTVSDCQLSGQYMGKYLME